MGCPGQALGGHGAIGDLGVLWETSFRVLILLWVLGGGLQEPPTNHKVNCSMAFHKALGEGFKPLPTF